MVAEGARDAPNGMFEREPDGPVWTTSRSSGAPAILPAGRPEEPGAWDRGVGSREGQAAEPDKAEDRPPVEEWPSWA